MQVRDQRAEVIEGPEPWVDVAVVVDGVPAVVGAGTGPQHRHQVQHVDAELGEVAEPSADAVEGASEALGVTDVADPLRALEPVRFQLTGPVAVDQRLRPVRRGRADHVEQLLLDAVGGVAVQPAQRRPQVRQPVGRPTREVERCGRGHRA